MYRTPITANLTRSVRRLTDRFYRRYGPFEIGDKIELPEYTRGYKKGLVRTSYCVTAEPLKLILAQIVLSRFAHRLNLVVTDRTHCCLEDHYYSGNHTKKWSRRYEEDLQDKWAIVANNTLLVFKKDFEKIDLMEKLNSQMV